MGMCWLSFQLPSTVRGAHPSGGGRTCSQLLVQGRNYLQTEVDHVSSKGLERLLSHLLLLSAVRCGSASVTPMESVVISIRSRRRPTVLWEGEGVWPNGVGPTQAIVMD